jgi:Uncharacterized protein conserved in bacteria
MEMAELGAAANEKRHFPVSDQIKQREARRWLKSLGYKPSLLDRFEEKGLVGKERIGTGRNSPLYYSRLEIQSALNALKMDGYVNGYQNQQ